MTCSEQGSIQPTATELSKWWP